MTEHVAWLVRPNDQVKVNEMSDHWDLHAMLSDEVMDDGKRERIREGTPEGAFQMQAPRCQADVRWRNTRLTHIPLRNRSTAHEEEVGEAPIRG